jgi:hypothetical protein
MCKGKVEGHMENTIKTIIDGIPNGLGFDTHTIIEKLIKDYSDVYLKSFCGDSTLAYHGKIGQIINDFCLTGMIEKIGESWSMNIHGNFSKCTCWRRIYE